MELPTVGDHCTFASCQSLDFLPFECVFCHSTFCSAHRLPQSHVCEGWLKESQANSVQQCPQCEKMVLTAKQQDPATILKEHQESGCRIHLLPPVQSIAVLCAQPGCRVKSRVVHTCTCTPGGEVGGGGGGGCGQTFCLAHRHPHEHDCPKLKELEQEAIAKQQRKQRLKASIQETFENKVSSSSSSSSSSLSLSSGVTSASAPAPALLVNEESRNERAEATKKTIAEAKAKLAARKAAAASTTTTTTSSTTATATATTAAAAAAASRSADENKILSSAGSSTATKPKAKKAPRMVSVLKLKKSAQGEDKIPLNSRLYLHIRSPLYPQLNDKAVFVDKTWTVGRSLDKITEWFKITPPMNMHQSFDATKRFSIFHAKEPEDVPKRLAMQDRLQQLPSVESGDTVYLAPADWDYSDL